MCKYAYIYIYFPDSEIETYMLKCITVFKRCFRAVYLTLKSEGIVSCFILAASPGGLLAFLMLGDVTSKAKAPLRVYCLDRLCGQAQRQICLVHSVLQISGVE